MDTQILRNFDFGWAAARLPGAVFLRYRRARWVFGAGSLASPTDPMVPIATKSNGAYGNLAAARLQ